MCQLIYFYSYGIFTAGSNTSRGTCWLKSGPATLTNGAINRPTADYNMKTSLCGIIRRRHVSTEKGKSYYFSTNNGQMEYFHHLNVYEMWLYISVVAAITSVVTLLIIFANKFFKQRKLNGTKSSDKLNCNTIELGSQDDLNSESSK
jgi:hypothetical protein